MCDINCGLNDRYSVGRGTDSAVHVVIRIFNLDVKSEYFRYFTSGKIALPRWGHDPTLQWRMESGVSNYSLSIAGEPTVHLEKIDFTFLQNSV